MASTRGIAVRGAIGGGCWGLAEKCLDYILAQLKPEDLYAWLQSGLVVMGLIPDWIVIIFIVACMTVSVWPKLVRQPLAAFHRRFGLLRRNPVLPTAPPAPSVFRQAPPAPLSQQPATRTETEPEKAAKHQLIMFIVELLLPAVKAQNELQTGILNAALSGNDLLISLADRGVSRSDDYRPLHDAFEKLNFWWSSKQIRTKLLKDLEDMVDEMKERYIAYCFFSEVMASHCHIDYKANPNLMPLCERGGVKIPPLWEKYKTRHNALHAAYGVIRNDYRLNRLHHPGGSDEFGPPV